MWRPIDVITDAGEPPDETDDSKDPASKTRSRLGIAPTTEIGLFVSPSKDLSAWVFGVLLPMRGDWARRTTGFPTSGAVFYDVKQPDGSAMDAWCALLRLRIRDNPIAVERHFHPSPYAGEELWRGVSGASLAEVKQARRYIGLLNFVETFASVRGRKPLEDSPTSPWRVVAEQAREIMRGDSTLRVPDVAARLLVNYEDLGGDSVAEARAEKAATRNLYRYLKLLNEVEERERSARSARPNK